METDVLTTYEDRAIWYGYNGIYLDEDYEYESWESLTC